MRVRFYMWSSAGHGLIPHGCLSAFFMCLLQDIEDIFPPFSIAPEGRGLNIRPLFSVSSYQGYGMIPHLGSPTTYVEHKEHILLTKAKSQIGL
jgi:hypothetical protein